MSKALTPSERRLEVARRIDERVRLKASRVVEAAMAAAELNDDGTPVGLGADAPSQDTKQFRVAMDARKPQRDAPVYLTMARRVLDSYRAVEAAKGPAPKLSAQVNIFVSKDIAQAYPVIDVTPEEK